MSEPLVRAYMTAIEQGDADAAIACLDPEMIFEELPNKVSPKGSRRDVPTIAASFAKGKALLEWQRYEIHRIADLGAELVAEVTWTGKVRGGPEMRCASAMFFAVRDGKILRQRNYDCFS